MDELFNHCGECLRLRGKPKKEESLMLKTNTEYTEGVGVAPQASAAWVGSTCACRYHIVQI